MFIKGRRKDKTQKWQLRAKFHAEALSFSGTRSTNQERFVRVAVKIGRNAEPVGVMAGISSAEFSTIIEL